MITVPTNKPNIIVTAIAPNKSSDNRGIMPNIVVNAAIITGRKREDDESSKAASGSLPEPICNVISSSKTTPFLIIIPISPKAPTIATNPKSLPVSNMPSTIPIIASGRQRKIIAGFLKSRNSIINMAIIITIAQGRLPKRYLVDWLLARYSPSHLYAYPSGKVIVSIAGIIACRTSSAVAPHTLLH